MAFITFLPAPAPTPAPTGIPKNFTGDVNYFGSPEYQAFQKSGRTEETADLAYTSPYFGAGLSSSRGARQDKAYQDYLNRIQGVPQSRPPSMTPTPDIFPTGLAPISYAPETPIGNFNPITGQPWGTAPTPAPTPAPAAPAPTPAAAPASVKDIDSSNFNKIYYGDAPYDPYSGEYGSQDYYLQDPNSGTVYSKVTTSVQTPWSNGDYWPVNQLDKVVATKEAMNNPDIQNLTNQYNWRGLEHFGKKYTDPAYAQQFYDLKSTNPDQYYNQLATDIGNQIAGNTALNKGEHNVAFNNQLNEIKDINKEAYYRSQLDMLGESVGWQIGQNRSDRNAPTIEKIKSLIPDAMASGLSADQINSIVGNGVNAANAQNQMRIANEAASGGNFWTENLIGAAKVGALALGAYGLDNALAAGAGASGGFGLTGASGAGGSMGAGSALQLAPAAMGAGTGIGGGIVAPSLAAGLGVGAGGVLGGGALSAETVATMEAMNAGAGYGLNASQVPNLAAGLELGAIPTSGLSSLLSNAGNLVKGASLAKGLLGAGKNPLQAQAVGAPQAQSRQYAGVDYSPILNLLSIQQPQRSKTSLLG